MAKLKDPITLTGLHGLRSVVLTRRGAYDPTLNVDTLLFVDPLLLSRSRARELRDGATEEFERYFEVIVRLLAASQSRGDAAWRSARQRLAFREIKENCLGYGERSVAGSAFGSGLQEQILQTAAEIVALGIRDPLMFALVPLLDDHVGPDRISDMTTHAILSSLARYTARVAGAAGIATEPFRVNNEEFALPVNPHIGHPSPKIVYAGRRRGTRAAVLLLPRDVLRALPIACDWDGVAKAAAQTQELREQVNTHIGAIWQRGYFQRHTKRDMRDLVMSGRGACESVLHVLRDAEIGAYDLNSDPNGVYRWRQVLQDIARQHPLALTAPRSAADVHVF